MASRYETHQRQADMEDARRFREHLPDKNREKDWEDIERIRRTRKEKKYWEESEQLVRRVWL